MARPQQLTLGARRGRPHGPPLRLLPGPAVACYHYQPAGAEVHPNRLGTVLVNLLVGPVALDGFVRVLVTFCEFPMHWTGLVRGRNKNQDACPLLFFFPISSHSSFVNCDALLLILCF